MDSRLNSSSSTGTICLRSRGTSTLAFPESSRKTAAQPTCFVAVPLACSRTASYAPRARPHRASHLGLLATFFNALLKRTALRQRSPPGQRKTDPIEVPRRPPGTLGEILGDSLQGLPAIQSFHERRPDLLFRPRGSARPALHHDDDFSKHLPPLVAGHQLRQRAPHQLLVDFGQLPGDASPTGAERGVKIAQQLQQPLGRLVENERRLE